jgi:hypothetical protein
MLLRALGITAATFLSTIGVEAAYSASKPNVFYYWGQVSYTFEPIVSILT